MISPYLPPPSILSDSQTDVIQRLTDEKADSAPKKLQVYKFELAQFESPCGVSEALRKDSKQMLEL